MFTVNTPLLMIGCGNMGRAMVKGWLESGAVAANSLVIVDRHPERLEALQADYPFRVFSSLEALEDVVPAAILLAIKPAGLADALPQMKARFADSKSLILTVLAGKETAAYEAGLWSEASIIRIMPNTPVAVRKGVSGLYANSFATAKECDVAVHLMEAVGIAIWLREESQMHALTAISGSGPAYIFYLLEVLSQIGTAQGFDAENAAALALHTVLGAASLSEKYNNKFNALREEVTSPNGTTAAGLDVLMSGDFLEVFARVIDAAKARSIALSSD